MPQVEIPIQPVDDPILCSPYEEPDQHWLYDTRTGVPSKNPGRRPASYWYKSERTGSAQMSLLAEEERDDLPLVNALRDDVRRWRKAGWPNARFNPESEAIKVGGVPVGRLGEETPEAFSRKRLGDLWDDEPLMVLNDERHHAYRPAPVGEKTKLSAEDTDAKHQAARRWVSAVNHWGRLGEWDFLVGRNRQSLGRGLSTLIDERRGRIRKTASLVHSQVERDVSRLR